MINCPYCGEAVEIDSIWCKYCRRLIHKGQVKGKLCPHCGADIDKDSEFCKHCGSSTASELTEGRICFGCNALIGMNDTYCRYCNTLGHLGKVFTSNSSPANRAFSQANTSPTYSPAVNPANQTNTNPSTNNPNTNVVNQSANTGANTDKKSPIKAIIGIAIFALIAYGIYLLIAGGGASKLKGTWKSKESDAVFTFYDISGDHGKLRIAEESRGKTSVLDFTLDGDELIIGIEGIPEKTTFTITWDGSDAFIMTNSEGGGRFTKVK